MKELVNRLINLGVDLGTRNTLKKALGVLGEEPENIDRLYIEIKNMIYREKIKNMKPEEKILFLPHCLRKSDKCKAKMTDEGYGCIECSGDCKVGQIKKGD